MNSYLFVPRWHMRDPSGFLSLAQPVVEPAIPPVTARTQPLRPETPSGQRLPPGVLGEQPIDELCGRGSCPGPRPPWSTLELTRHAMSGSRVPRTVPSPRCDQTHVPASAGCPHGQYRTPPRPHHPRRPLRHAADAEPQRVAHDPELIAVLEAEDIALSCVRTERRSILFAAGLPGDAILGGSPQDRVELLVPARRGIDEPAVAGGVLMDPDGLRGCRAEIRAGEIGDLEVEGSAGLVSIKNHRTPWSTGRSPRRRVAEATLA